jgi:hypothetical protein
VKIGPNPYGGRKQHNEDASQREGDLGKVFADWRGNGLNNVKAGEGKVERRTRSVKGWEYHVM